MSKPTGKIQTDDKRLAALEAEANEVAAVWVATEALHAWDKNPRKNQKAIPRVAASIKRFGFGNPILARKNGEIIGGHTRWEAAKALGLARVPVRYMDLDPAEAHLLAMADNKLGEIAEWDAGQAAAVLSEYGLDEAEVAGFTKAELDKLGAELAGAESSDAETYDRPQVFGVIVECNSEAQQLGLLTRFAKEGLSCRALM